MRAQNICVVRFKLYVLSSHHSIDSQHTPTDSLITTHISLILYSSGVSSQNSPKPLMDVIQNILSTIMRFSSQLLSLNVKLTSLTHTHRTFRENTNLLVKGWRDVSQLIFNSHILYSSPVVQKLVERGYQPHLSEFLLRLNFNKFYK